jgi:hypothetical protein
MKIIQDFYVEISYLLRKEHPDIWVEFKNRIVTENPKQVFMWLQSELEQRNISNKLEGVMTDFFYSIH